MYFTKVKKYARYDLESYILVRLVKTLVWDFYAVDYGPQ